MLDARKKQLATYHLNTLELQSFKLIVNYSLLAAGIPLPAVSPSDSLGKRDGNTGHEGAGGAIISHLAPTAGDFSQGWKIRGKFHIIKKCNA